jgi:hypothetical protein
MQLDSCHIAGRRTAPLHSVGKFIPFVFVFMGSTQVRDGLLTHFHGFPFCFGRASER